MFGRFWVRSVETVPMRSVRFVQRAVIAFALVLLASSPGCRRSASSPTARLSDAQQVLANLHVGMSEGEVAGILRQHHMLAGVFEIDSGLQSTWYYKLGNSWELALGFGMGYPPGYPPGGGESRYLLESASIRDGTGRELAVLRSGNVEMGSGSTGNQPLSDE